MICKKCEADLVEKCTRCGEEILNPPKNGTNWKENINEYYKKNNGSGTYNCLHDNCSGCKNGTCSGMHMISCPCPKCSPRMI